MKATNGWPNVRLGEHVELLTGFPFKSQRFTFDLNDTALVKGENVAQGRIDWEISKRWPAAELTQFEQYRLRSGDVVLAMDRPWIEAGLKYAWIKPHDQVALLVQRVSRLRGCATLDQTFLRYVIGSPAFTNYIKPIVTGVNVPHISPQQIKDFRFRLPPVAIQRKAAAILSAYDDLIENNTRRIQSLERMAQALYREWFVHYRFPGHAKVKLVASTLGQIPQGWGVTALKQITTKIGSGATPRGGKESYQSSGVSLIRSLNVYDYCFTDDNLAFINDAQAAQLDHVAVEARDILLNITGASVARCCISPSYRLPARVNQHVAIIRVNQTASDPYFILDTINSTRSKQKLLGLAQGGATREALTKETVGNFQVIQPPQPIFRRYSSVVGDYHQLREVLHRKNLNLRRTRDLLLPKLISGALDVSKLENETT